MYEFYCEKDPDNGEYNHFFHHASLVRMCGASNEDIVYVEVSISENNEGSHWAYLEYENNELKFIFPSLMQVKLCSADFFNSAIENGLGEFVNVTIHEFQY